ncbi:bifunctional helix-turn-helix transcriptional regulator/GNAT family N-acetyltransferase [Novosphingobium beihaiensis]|uniref:Helix-turn-helix domain-containing GNAT family N-acetyltransferase n=1 Tax=Novosphingobium beihaiensis TaxID=2930389 RepID=A0ABT0BPC2_9SPHN|nr:helix-turn-helix domain-containing GNAT family N-acetyltransferase [Novosphingobium beihaiensis]MCJ2186795.1 helix-turn-helix domain-containing GNAT family N-acetyltransferase [Novosphingobium beihaiensis]
MNDPRHDKDVATLRAFNRIYTRRLGLLDAHLDRSPFTLSEARVLYELAHREDPTAADLARILGLDPAQMSRTLKRFASRGLTASRGDPAHRKHQLLSLTEEGRAAYAALERNTRAAVGELLDELPLHRRNRLLSAAEAITRIFGGDTPPAPALRGLRPGDLGMVAARQAILYAREYGWDAGYEALAARILADFQQDFDPARDAAWIAELDGRMAGSIFLVHGDTPDVGKLRLLYVEPDARGCGIGRLLVDTCIQRAREMGYGQLMLWTNSVLTAARRIYERTGFQLAEEAPHHSFGQDLTGQTWTLDLRKAP